MFNGFTVCASCGHLVPVVDGVCLMCGEIFSERTIDRQVACDDSDVTVTVYSPTSTELELVA
jgi:hypothetical protein